MDDFDIEDLIEEEEVVITMTHIGYIKRISADNYRSQKRGGKGITALSTRENDFVEQLFTTTTHHYLMFFTNFGKVYRLKAFEVPEAGRTARGTAIVNLLPLEDGEQIATMIPIKEFSDDKYLVMATKQGIIKKTNLTEYDTSRKNGIIAINLREADELINVRLVETDEEIVMGTQCGYAIRFNSEDVRSISRTSIGVRGIDLRDDDVVVGMDILKDDLFVLCVSENGYGKLSASDLYRPQKRGGKGVQTYKVTKKTGELVGFCVINRDGEIMMINNQGVVIKLQGNDITAVGRNTQGVRLMKLKPDESIATISKVYKEDPIDVLDEINEKQIKIIDDPVK